MEVGECERRRSKVLSGAIAEIDRLMNDHGLDADDIISQLHDVLVGRRLSLPDELRSELLSALAICDTQIRSIMHARIPFENFHMEGRNLWQKARPRLRLMAGAADSNPRSLA